MKRNSPLFSDLTKAFSLFDYDKDGVISNDDMCIVLKSLGHKITDHELDELIKSIDSNGIYFYYLHIYFLLLSNLNINDDQFIYNC